MECLIVNIAAEFSCKQHYHRAYLFAFAVAQVREGTAEQTVLRCECAVEYAVELLKFSLYALFYLINGFCHLCTVTVFAPMNGGTVYFKPQSYGKFYRKAVLATDKAAPI